MKFKLEVEGRPMVLYSGEGGGKPSDDGPHTAYALGRKDVHQDLAAFRRLIRVFKAEMVCELFGGSGWHAASIQELVGPSNHIVMDIDEDCFKSMRVSLKGVPGLRVFKADAYAYAAERLASKPFDWVHADFNRFTLMRGAREPQYSKALDGIFGSKAREVVTITDSTLFGLRFPKNREAYETLLGTKVQTPEQYYDAATRWFHSRFGFAIRRVITWGNMSSMYTLRRGKVKDLKISKQLRAASVKLEGGE